MSRLFRMSVVMMLALMGVLGTAATAAAAPGSQADTGTSAAQEETGTVTVFNYLCDNLEAPEWYGSPDESCVEAPGTFTFYLVDDGSGVPTTQLDVDETGTGTTEAPEAPATILLVDDEEAVRSLVRRILEKEGYRVATAANGQEALRRAYELDRPIGLLLTDVVMPGMSGSDLAARLSERFPALRVLYMSGYMEDEVVHRDVASASAGFLPKPFSPFDLALAVRELFGPPEGPASTDG